MYERTPVTIASVRAHGVRQLLVYCLGKRERDWPCHHQGKLPIDRFRRFLFRRNDAAFADFPKRLPQNLD
jgi:hypothetical protein